MEGLSPHSPPKQYKLRAAAHDLEFDRLLANLTLPETRDDLPGYLFLFSNRTFMLDESDTDIDGHSNNKVRIQTLQMQASKHDKTKFSLTPQIEKVRPPGGDHANLLRLQLTLGSQAASQVMMPAFFDEQERQSTLVPLTYFIPNPVRTRTMGLAFDELKSYLEDQPRGIVDELSLVTAAHRFRTYRQRVRKPTQ